MANEVWEKNYANCKTRTELEVLAEDLIVATGASRRVWVRKLEEAQESHTSTKLQVLIEDLLVIFE